MGKSLLCLFVFLSLISSLVYAQISITGKILNDENGEPIANASVYINNTTIGSNTGATGDYVLRGIKPGIYEIIVSHVGYEMIVYRIEVKNQDLKFVFRLAEKVKQMRNIVIMTSDLRKKWMANFRKNFLGSTGAAAKTKIKNEDDVFFEKGPSSSGMIAFSETPLVIENQELGYRIYFQLVEFLYDEADGLTYFLGFSRFEELNGGESVKRKHKKARENYYRGSTQHFFHALLADDLVNQNFSIYFSGSVENNNPVDKPAQPGNLSMQYPPEKKSPRIAVAVTVADILFKDDTTSDKFYLKWEGDLNVRYKLNPYTKNYLKMKGFYDGFLPTGVQSGIRMLSSPAYIDKNGSLDNPMAVQYTGYWSYERLAGMLPKDYRPEK